jgi:NhaA family Na+:H+ antiporter
MTDAINEFLALEAAGGILLMAATALAPVAANSPAVGLYNAFFDAPDRRSFLSAIIGYTVLSSSLSDASA